MQSCVDVQRRELPWSDGCHVPFISRTNSSMAYDCHMETQPYGLVAIWQISMPSSVTNAGCSSSDPTGHSSTTGKQNVCS